MYTALERRRLSGALADAFLHGRWRAEDLADRGAAALDRRPEWLDPLARAAESTQLSPPLREVRWRLIAFIDGWLEGQPPAAPPDPPSTVVWWRRPRPRHPARDPHPARGPVIDRGWAIARIESTAALAERLELSDGQLAWLSDVRSLERSVDAERLRNYRYRWLPRASGLPRLIEAPKLRLKEVQRWVLREILDQVPAHDAAHGFTRGRSVRTHAALHAGRPAVLSLDLRDFFASVAAGRVFGIFRTLGYAPSVAHVLTGLCTNVVPRGVWAAVPAVETSELVWARFHLGRALAAPHLPQGAPTSPALANLAAFALDRRLSGLAAKGDLRYSRYADDLTLSGAGLTGSRSRALAAVAAKIAREEGFALQPRKSRLRTAARRQVVTGIVVNAHPNVAREEYDRLRATLHRVALDGPGGAGGAGGEAGGADRVDLRAHLNGRVSWVESLNPRRGAKLRRQFDQIDWHAAAGPGAP